MKFIQVLIDHQTNKQIAARLFLIFRRELAKGLRQDLVGRAIADFVNNVLIHFGKRPGIADGSATLGRDAGKFYLAAN